MNKQCIFTACLLLASVSPIDTLIAQNLGQCVHSTGFQDPVGCNDTTHCQGSPQESQEWDLSGNVDYGIAISYVQCTPTTPFGGAWASYCSTDGGEVDTLTHCGGSCAACCPNVCEIQCENYNYDQCNGLCGSKVTAPGRGDDGVSSVMLAKGANHAGHPLARAKAPNSYQEAKLTIVTTASQRLPHTPLYIPRTPDSTAAIYRF